MSKLIDIKAKFENLINDIEVELEFVDELDKRQRIVDESMLTIAMQQKDNEKRHYELVNKEKSLGEREAYMVTREKIVAKLDDQAKNLAVEKEAFLSRQRETIIKEKELETRENVVNTKIEALKKLENQAVELTHEQALIEKEKAVDRQRKGNLDLREGKIKTRERQLQIESDTV